MTRLKHIAIQFRPLTAPTGSATVVTYYQPPELETGKPSSTAPAPPPLVGLGMPNRDWSWPATLAFLSGFTSWETPATLAQTNALDGLSLAQYAGRLATQQTPYTLRSVNRGFRLIARLTRILLSNVGALPAGAIDPGFIPDVESEVRKRSIQNLQEDVAGWGQVQYVPDVIRAKRQKFAELEEERLNEGQESEEKQGDDAADAKVKKKENAEHVDDEEDGKVPA
ncbi:MAG: hypothetical protein Q9225_001283 [Loekoesia sp. 1 TL-2023]